MIHPTRNPVMQKAPAIFFSLFTFTTCAFSQNYNNDGDTVFASSSIHNIYFNFYDAGYYDSLTASYTTDLYYTCNMVFDGTAFDSVGVKFKGNSSYNIQSQKKSMKVDLDFNIPGQDIDDLNKFNLNNLYHDPTCLREKLISDFCIRNGIPAPRVTYAKVYYNNQYWGLYTLVEEVNSDFVDAWFNEDVGNLFKGDPSGDLKWINSSESSYYNKYELKTNETLNDWSDLVTFIDKINNTAIADLRDTLDNYFDVTGFLRNWAVCNIFVSLDSYIGSRHNYYLYHDSTDNRFKWIMWDMNSCFGVFNQSMSVTQMENLSPFYLGNPPAERPLCYRLLQDAATQQELTYWFCVFLQSDQFSNANLDPLIDSLSDRIRADIYADPNYTYTDQQFENNRTMTVNADNKSYPGLKPFITARVASLTNSLAPYGCYLAAGETFSNNTFTVYPNPASTSVTIGLDGVTEKVIVSLTDLTGRSVFTLTAENTSSVTIDLSTFAAGTYILAMNNTGIKKLEIIK